MNIFKITIDDINDPEEGLMAISLVDFPAVETNFLKFRDEKKRITLKADDDQHIITGIALLADTPIYRYDPAMGGDYYIVFERETIKQLVQKYSKDGLLNVINLQHDSETYSVDSCTMIESYFTNKERGVCPAEFVGIPDGSWIVSFKVTDEELWQKIKASNGEEGGLNGFSVEVCAGIAPKLKKEKKAVDKFSILIRDCFSVTKAEAVEAMYTNKQLDITIDDGDEEYTERVQFNSIGDKDGKMVAIAYIPSADKWEEIDLGTITSIVVTEEALVPWNYDTPSYKTVENDEDVVVTESGIADRSAIEACIDGQYFAMITYNDESEEHTPATGMRQVQVCAYGTTLKGNECFRAYEYYGDTSQSLPGGTGNWRIFLTRRCRSFHIMTEAQRWAVVPPGYRSGDVDMTTIYKEIVPSKVNPYPAGVTRNKR